MIFGRECHDGAPASRWCSDAPSRPAGPPGRSRSRSGPSAVNEPCALVRRARRGARPRRTKLSVCSAAAGCCAGHVLATEWLVRAAAPRACASAKTSAASACVRAPARTRQHASAVGDTHGALCSVPCEGWHTVCAGAAHRHPAPSSPSPPSSHFPHAYLHPRPRPRPHARPHSRPHRTLARALMYSHPLS